MLIFELLLALTAARADGGMTSDRQASIRACLNPGAGAGVVHRAQSIASQILGPTNVHIEWRGDERRCKTSGIVIRLSYQTPEESVPGALAMAFPYGRQHVALFYDRVVRLATPDALASVLGHVLAHELVHMLQGLSAHSAAGLMKARWERPDYVRMQRGRLPLDEGDIRLVRRGLTVLTRSR